MELETRVWWRYVRCLLVQGTARALLWIVMISAAGYAAYKMSACPIGQTCASPQKMKAQK